MKRTAAIVVVVLAVVVAITLAVFAKTSYVIPVLMYHSIDHNDRVSKLSVSPESFRRQMEFLRAHHYNIVDLETIQRYMQRKEKVPPKTVAITFDDGFYNNYQNAFPVLKEFKIPATMFVIVDKIGQPGWMGWNELKEMSGSGLVTIGSHTLSHPWLTALGTKALHAELDDSKQILERQLGRKVDFLCYPMGVHKGVRRRLVIPARQGRILARMRQMMMFMPLSASRYRTLPITCSYFGLKRAVTIHG